MSDSQRGWITLRIPGGDLALELLDDALARLGARGYNTAGEDLLAFFSEVEDEADLLRRAKELVTGVRDLLPGGAEEVRLERVTEEDWVARWRRSLGPVRAGDHFLIVPPGVEAEPEPGDKVLRIEPRMAFGTGEHPTTRMALALMEGHVTPGDRVLDMGCGNGVLAIGAALLGAERVLAFDNEEEAIAETRENAERHGVAERIRVAREDVLDLPDTGGPADLLLANIFVTPILQGLDDWLRRTRKGATVILTGVQQGDEEGRLIAALPGFGLRVDDTTHLDTWFAVRCVRDSS